MAKLPTLVSVTLVSATIVLMLTALHSPSSLASPDNQFPENNQTDPVETPQPLSEDMQIADPPGTTPKLGPSNLHYYPYEQQLTFRYGRAGNLSDRKLEDNLIGFQYLFPKFLSPKLEAGADLQDGGEGHVHVGLRWYWNEKGYFRPSGKVSGDVLMISKENLATFAHIGNYYVRASGTLEYVVWNPYSVRLENEIYLGTKNRLINLTLGISRGW
jgi:hypothetical protein